MKRIFTILVGVILLFVAFPAVFAEETETLSPLEHEIINEAAQTYKKAQRFAGRRSFHGRCGLLVGTQLRCLGINTKKISFHGKDNYDYYADLEVTTGGYYVMPYPSESYDLLGALQAVSENGKKDVRNILVGFQWTNTDAGNMYGHAMFINGIVNGTVYFVESFHSPLGGPEGTVNRCSMEEFAKSYNRWTEFEGLIHFGVGNYYDVCARKETDLTVQTRFTTVLRSQPALIGEKKCQELRSISAGEQFRATGIFGYGRSLYYRVETENGIGFVSCNAMSPVKANEEGIALSQEREAVFSGTVNAQLGLIDSLEVCITDDGGQLVRREIAEVSKTTAELSFLEEKLLLELLEDGQYQVEIYVIRTCPVVVRGQDTEQHARHLLKKATLKIGT